MCVSVRACMRACLWVCACVCVCVRACVRENRAYACFNVSDFVNIIISIYVHMSIYNM